MEGYIQALIDTHRRKIKSITSPIVLAEMEDRILELQSILDYCNRKELVKNLSSFVVSCKAKDLSEELRRVCK
ncbi:hypothetical protein [Clostridium sp.]|uniref:hypothetical protein n=1 Tax=Clostridium sp. TaxID=1506 RepID=UPI0026156BEC|nr:hypothetical protein [Clostridium sp.]